MNKSNAVAAIHVWNDGPAARERGVENYYSVSEVDADGDEIPMRRWVQKTHQSMGYRHGSSRWAWRALRRVCYRGWAGDRSIHPSTRRIVRAS